MQYQYIINSNFVKDFIRLFPAAGEGQAVNRLSPPLLEMYCLFRELSLLTAFREVWSAASPHGVWLHSRCPTPP